VAAEVEIHTGTSQHETEVKLAIFLNQSSSMTLNSKIPSVKETNRAQITALCALCPTVRRIVDYAQNYVRAHNCITPLSL